MGRLMSDAEIRHRKKVQGHVSQATGALGLAALGGTLAASRGGRNTLRKIPKLESKIKAPPPKDPNRDRIKGVVTPALATSAGLGGLGSFNFAAYTNAESRKRKQAVPVAKSLDMGWFGEEGHQVELEEIVVPIEKSWTPSASNYDPEAKRLRRNKDYEVAAVGATAGGAVGTAMSGGKYVRQGGKAKKLAETLKSPKSSSKFRALKTAQKATGKRAALGAGVTVASAGGAALLHNRNKSKSWQPYAKNLAEVEKFDRGPKVKVREQSLHEVGSTGQKFYAPTHAVTESKGKSLILRRNKYQVNTLPSAVKVRSDSRYALEISPNQKADKSTAAEVERSYQTGAKKIRLGGRDLKHEVHKSAFGVDHMNGQHRETGN